MTRPPFPALSAAAQDFHDRQRDVQADQVEQGERAHRQANSGPGGGVDVRTARVARLQQGDRVVQVGQQQGVRDEPGPVGHRHRGLAETLNEPGNPVTSPRAGQHRGDDLDQPHHRGRVEEMQADDPAGVRRAGRDRRHRQRGGVGGQDGVRPAGTVKLAEHGELGIEPLWHGPHGAEPDHGRRAKLHAGEITGRSKVAKFPLSNLPRPLAP
jgi:hypothetical protein